MDSSRFLHAFSLLLQASDYSTELACDGWDFAVELDLLRRSGLTNSDIRWLLVKGLLIHAVELVPPPAGKRRAFAVCQSLALQERSCFILTPEGVRFALAFDVAPHDADRILPVAAESLALPTAVETPGSEAEAGIPYWDKDRRMLLFRNQIVKQFKVPAPNQELLLAAFQEEGWPHHIDDPLPRVGLIDPKRRLHDTIATLNRNQRARLLRFFGDGHAQGLCWEALTHAVTRAPHGWCADPNAAQPPLV
jgi:hypothetical protein